MPEESTIFYCKMCRAEFSQIGHARVCEENHLHREDLKIINLAHVPGRELCYMEGDPMPASIVVNGLKSGQSATYIRLDIVHRRKRAGKVRLDGK